jgi:hypothetical protein
MSNKAQPITLHEWSDLAMLPIVQKEFGLTAIPSLDQVKVQIYGAKFISFIRDVEDSIITTYTLMGDKGEALILQAYKGQITQLGAKQ